MAYGCFAPAVVFVDVYKREETGNEMGLTEQAINALEPAIRERRLKRAYDRMAQAGAHYVVDGIGDVEPALDEIQARVSRGEKP